MAKFSSKDTILSSDIWGKSFSDCLEMLLWIASCNIFSIWYKLIYLSLPLNPAIYRMGNVPNILCPRCKEKEEPQPYFIFYCKLPKITLRFFSEITSLKYAFNIPFKIILKTIIKRTSFQFHDGVQLNILLTLSSEILKYYF